MKLLSLLLPFVFLSSPCFAASVTAKQTLQRGTIIQSGDLTVEADTEENRQDVLEGYLGKEMKRTVYAGKKVNPAYVGNPILVKRNSLISMIYRFGRLEITASGRALDEGGEGDIISIMNLESRKRIHGIILPSGVVEVRT